MIIEEPTLKVVRMDDKGYFQIIDPLIFSWIRKRCVITVPPDTLTNFASIPAPLRSLFPVNGSHRLAAIVHDYLYGLGGQVETQTFLSFGNVSYESISMIKVVYSRKEADDLFFDLMRLEGVNYFKAAAMYSAVRLFGKFAWKGV